MDIIGLLENKLIKSIEKKHEIVEAMKSNIITITDLLELTDKLDDKKIAVILEAMESVTGKKPELANLDWLKFAEGFIKSESNTLKREASRVVGNISHLFPNELETVIQKLIENSNNDGTVVRWGSAYALGRIIIIPQFANSELYDILTNLSEQENENGVKNQYCSGLKKARKIRK